MEDAYVTFIREYIQSLKFDDAFCDKILKDVMVLYGRFPLPSRREIIHEYLKSMTRLKLNEELFARLPEKQNDTAGYLFAFLMRLDYFAGQLAEWFQSDPANIESSLEGCLDNAVVDLCLERFDVRVLHTRDAFPVPGSELTVPANHEAVIVQMEEGFDSLHATGFNTMPKAYDITVPNEPVALNGEVNETSIAISVPAGTCLLIVPAPPGMEYWLSPPPEDQAYRGMRPVMRSSMVTNYSFIKRMEVDPTERDWDLFYSKYSHLILSYSRLKGADHELSQEVLQCVMVKLMRKLPNFEYDPKRGRFRSWLNRITYFTFLEQYRKRNTAPTPAEGIEDELADPSDAQEKDGLDDLDDEGLWKYAAMQAAIKHYAEWYSQRDSPLFQYYIQILCEIETPKSLAEKHGRTANAYSVFKSEMTNRLRKMVDEFLAENPNPQIDEDFVRLKLEDFLDAEEESGESNEESGDNQKGDTEA